VPALESWLITPRWDQFRALLPQRPAYHPNHPLGCHRPRIPDRVIFDKLVQALVFGCGYRKLADAACSATTIRDRRDEWIQLGEPGMRLSTHRALHGFARQVGFAQGVGIVPRK
jgi:transposase